jgi:hypothetical protein
VRLAALERPEQALLERRASGAEVLGLLEHSAAEVEEQLRPALAGIGGHGCGLLRCGR